MPQRTYADGDEGDGLVNPSEGGDINSLSSDGTLRSNTGAVLSRAGVDDGVDEDLDGVLVGEEVDDFEGVGNDADGEELLAVVASLHHQATLSSAQVRVDGDD